MSDVKIAEVSWAKMDYMKSSQQTIPITFQLSDTICPTTWNNGQIGTEWDKIASTMYRWS
jgi:hypothetical protein